MTLATLDVYPLDDLAGRLVAYGLGALFNEAGKLFLPMPLIQVGFNVSQTVAGMLRPSRTEAVAESIEGARPGAAGAAAAAAATVPRSVDGAGASGRQWNTEIPALEKTPTALQAVQNGETLE